MRFTLLNCGILLHTGKELNTMSLIELEKIFPLSRLHIDIFSKYVCFANYVVVRGESYDEKSEIVDVRLVKTVFNAKSQ